MVAKYRIELLVCGVLLCFLMSCGERHKQVEEALSLSGENRRELEMVLEHYQDSALKLKAAEFLIANMSGLSVADTISLAAHRPFYKTCDSIRLLYKATQRRRWAMLVDSLWDVYKVNTSPGRIKYIPLLKTITANQLIAEIEMAFSAWKTNEFSKDCSFDDFCEYILPCYRGNAFVLDDARLHFYKKYNGSFYADKEQALLVQTDSVLFQYKGIGFDTFYGSDIPSLSMASLMQVGGGRCTERGIFNSQLLSSLGMPIAVDFIPSWGNRNSPHSWNVLVVGGKHYAFDPFWNDDNWVYNQLYSNTGIYDPTGMGEFRPPKVYRKTYSTHMESTLLNKGINIEDIPSLFRNFKMKDVSSDYFEAVDVEVELTETPPQDAQYAYLCVFDAKGWLTVQYGKIVDGKAVFSGMGRNIVYLPAYYKNGQIMAAATPFLLRMDGTTQLLKSTGQVDETVAISGVEPDAMRNKSYLNCMSGAVITERIAGETRDTLCEISGALPIEHTTYKLKSSFPCRFLRLDLPSDSLALGDLSFYSPEGKITDVKITSTIHPLGKDSSPDLIFDDFKSTCYRGKANERFVDIDLGREYVLTLIKVSPYVRPLLFTNSNYELFYWGNGWEALDKQKGGVDYLIFKNIPRNVLLRLKQSTETDRKVRERIFVYENGEIRWM